MQQKPSDLDPRTKGTLYLFLVSMFFWAATAIMNDGTHPSNGFLMIIGWPITIFGFYYAASGMARFAKSWRSANFLINAVVLVLYLLAVPWFLSYLSNTA